MTKSILVTCPPMIGMIDQFENHSKKLGLKLVPAKVSQTLSINELIELVPNYEGWIIGDDPASREVVYAGKQGKLTAAVKWGIGTDNIDFNAFESLDLPIENTPGMFGNEVADIALGYLISLSRNTFQIDKAVRKGDWIKPIGISLKDKIVGVVGFGDIGQSTAKRLIACDMKVIAYDPFYSGDKFFDKNVEFANWPVKLEKCDFIIFNCALTKSSFHMVNNETIQLMKKGVRIINVSRGQVIHEISLIKHLESGHIHSVALDVYENEPISINSPLTKSDRTILGTHNASNTFEAVKRTSLKALDILSKLLNKND